MKTNNLQAFLGPINHQWEHILKRERAAADLFAVIRG
jgi:hypothetical protein